MTLSITPEKRAHLARIGSLGGLTAAVTVDTEARATYAQSRFRRSFETGHGCSVCPTIYLNTEDPILRAKQADRLYRLHFKRIRMARR